MPKAQIGVSRGLYKIDFVWIDYLNLSKERIVCMRLFSILGLGKVRLC